MNLDLKRIGLEACLLIVFGALLGLSLNYRLVMDAFAGSLVPPQCSAVDARASAVMPLPVLLDEVQQMKASGGLVVDARNPELYALGHIEGAVSLPLVEIDAALPDFLARVAKDQPLIIYCNGFGCPDSFDLGVFLIDAGYQDVRVFEGGYPEWNAAGLPVAGESR
jgi:rhodanese-related sulfurtransferase